MVIDGVDEEVLNFWCVLWNFSLVVCGFYNSGICVVFEWCFCYIRGIFMVCMVYCVKFNKEVEGFDFLFLFGELGKKFW